MTKQIFYILILIPLLNLIPLNSTHTRKYKIYNTNKGKIVEDIYKYLLVGYRNTGEIKTIDISNLETTKYFKSFRTNFHGEDINVLEISPDRRYFISGDSNGSIKLFNLRTGQLLQEFNHNYIISCLAISHNNKYIASQSEHNNTEEAENIKRADNGTIKIWNTETGRLVNIFLPIIEHYRVENNANSISFSSDNRLLACGYTNGFIRILDVETGELVKEFESFEDFMVINSAILTANNKFLISGSEDIMRSMGEGKIKVWNIETGQIHKTFNYNAKITTIALSSNENFLVSAARDKTLRIWDLDGNLLKTIRLNKVPFILAISSDEEHIAYSTIGNKQIQIYEIKTGIVHNLASNNEIYGLILN